MVDASKTTQIVEIPFHGKTYYVRRSIKEIFEEYVAPISNVEFQYLEEEINSDIEMESAMFELINMKRDAQKAVSELNKELLN